MLELQLLIEGCYQIVVCRVGEGLASSHVLAIKISLIFKESIGKGYSLSNLKSREARPPAFLGTGGFLLAKYDGANAVF